MGRLYPHFSSSAWLLCWTICLGSLCGSLPPAARAANAPAPAAPAASASPEQQTQDTLVSYLQKMDPDRLTTVAGMKVDRSAALDRIKLLEPSGRSQELMDVYLFYLTQLPPDPKDYLEILSRLTYVLEQRDDNAGLLTLLFQLADHFPPSSATVQQIRLIQGEYLLRVAGPEAALVVLHRLANQPTVSPSVRMLAAGRAGYLHERMGQTDDAIATYLVAGQDLTVGAQANEAVLRASLLLLQQGDMDQALAAIAKLRDIPAAVLRSSPAAPVITDLLALSADPARARAYWAASAKWFPQWTILSERLGVKPPPAGQPVLADYIDNYRQATLQAGSALGQPDAAAYFQITDQFFHSGRWRVSDLGDAASKLYAGLALAPQRADDVLAFGQILEQAIPDTEKDLHRQLTQLRLAALVDPPINKPALARDAAQVALQKYGADAPSGQALARLYGYAVLRSTSLLTHGAEAAQILAGTLADPTAHGAQHMMAVAVLGDLYVGLGRENDARALLEKELTGPADPNDRLRIALQNELATFRERGLQAAGLNSGLDAWWAQHRVPWYDFVNSPPQSGPLSTADEPAVQLARDFSRALDHTTTLAVRAVSFESAWNPYVELFPHGVDVVSATADLAVRQELPLDLRYLAWSRAVLHLFWTGQREAGEKLLATAPSGGATAADDRADFDLWDEYLAQPNIPAAQQAFAEKIFALPAVRRPVLLLMVRIVNTLACLTEYSAAQATFEKLGTAKLDDGAKQQYNGLKPGIADLIANYQSSGPIAEALRKLVLDARAQDAAAAQLPASWRALNDIWSPNLALLTLADRRQGLLAIIRDRVSYGRFPLQAYLDYADALSFKPDDAALRLKIFETAQKLAQSDADRFYAAMFMSTVDFDDPAIAKTGWADLAPARTAAYPRAGGFIQYYDALMQWRTGGKFDAATIFGPLDAPNLDSYKLRLVMDYYLQQQDKAGLQKLLDARPKEDDFLQPVVLGAYVRALRLLGKSVALTHATDAARLEIAKSVVRSWAAPDSETVSSVIALARSLNDPSAYPRAWVNDILAALHNENDLALVRLADGCLQSDWAGVLDAANDYLARNPTNYDAYWSKAQALLGLNRRKEALEPLRLYVKYSHNEDDYPQAVELLKKIEAESGTTTAAKK